MSTPPLPSARRLRAILASLALLITLVVTPAANAVPLPDGSGPVCADQTAQVAFNTPAKITYSCGGDGLTYQVQTYPRSATYLDLGADWVLYSPYGGFSGSDEFMVKAIDGANRSATFKVIVTVEGPRDLTADPNDQLTGQDADDAWALEPGQVRTYDVSCARDKYVTDGRVLVQTVDQGTGEPADIEVLKAMRVGGGTFEFRLRNPTAGRAQGHFALACVSRTTFKGHSLDINGAVSGSIRFFGEDDAFTKTVTLTCAAGLIPIAPGYDIRDNGSAQPIQSEATPDGRGWRFTFASWSTAQISLEVQCLGYSDRAQQVLLRAYRTSTSPTFAGGTPTKRDTPLDCEVGFVGLVGGYSTTPDLPYLGQETQAKRRLFWVQNLSDEERSATFSLLCVALVTDTTSSPITPGGGVPSLPVPSLTPTPTPTSTTVRSAAITARSLRATGGGQVTTTVRCTAAEACAGAIVLTTSAGTTIGAAAYEVRAGRSAKVRIRLNAAGRRALRQAHGKRLRVTATVGGVPTMLTLKR